VTELGTCLTCHRRFALRRNMHGIVVLGHHNGGWKKLCAGVGTIPVVGSVTFQESGRAIERNS
jgi:hypothetical protein